MSYVDADAIYTSLLIARQGTAADAIHSSLMVQQPAQVVADTLYSSVMVLTPLTWLPEEENAASLQGAAGELQGAVGQGGVRRGLQGR